MSSRVAVSGDRLRNARAIEWTASLAKIDLHVDLD
jgi:hypothetical protein